MTNFDELNKLSTWEKLNEHVGYKRSEPFKDYFAPMRISDKRKTDRIDFAEKLEDEFNYLLAFLFYMQISKNIGIQPEELTSLQLQAQSATEVERLREQIKRVYLEGLRREDAYLRARADQMTAETILTTYKHSDDPYYYSADRGRKLAEEEANTAFNHIEFEEAVDIDGATLKTWQTVADSRVRDTHDEIEGMTLPIGEPFEVGGSLMDYPRDVSYDAGPEEIVNCRCSLEFS